MRKFVVCLFMLAFLVGLTDGRRVMIPGAVGFGVTEQDGVGIHVFFDAKATIVHVIPTELIAIVIYRSDDKEL